MSEPKSLSFAAMACLHIQEFIKSRQKHAVGSICSCLNPLLSFVSIHSIILSSKSRGQRANALYCLLIINKHLLLWAVLSWPKGEMAEADGHHNINASPWQTFIWGVDCADLLLGVGSHWIVLSFCLPNVFIRLLMGLASVVIGSAFTALHLWDTESCMATHPQSRLWTGF